MKRSIIPMAALLAFGVATPVEADTFVLVHGAFQSAVVWDEVAETLRSEGHNAIAVDLPGRNAVGVAAQTVTLQDYIEATRAVVEAASEPVILVGHSFGGITVSGVAEAVPDQVDLLVYVAAYLPQSGESMETLALSDADNAFTAETFVIAEDYSHATILDTDQVRVFAADATPEQAAALRASMVREPLPPIGTPVMLTDERIGSVPSAYIRTLKDGTVSPELQTQMIERAEVETVRDLPSGHAPYLTRPDNLARLLMDIAEVGA
ncbi:MAG: alpha/beta fold hydrolase [Silicimonas sp.]|uniref:alpha/beta fold hydrolase n=2 Tax=Roseitalea porphyridii TaxID=1852022 RepID=UPI0032F00DFF